MRFFRPVPRIIFSVFCVSLILFSSPSQSQVPAPQLGMIPTAETLGKGGYMTTFGLFQFEEDRLAPDRTQPVIIGNFEESHRVVFEAETFLVPIRLTYGIGDRLDFIFGGTFSTGGVRKIIPDFYGVGDTSQDRRVYNQSLFDGVVGFKYNIKPDLNDNMPSLSVGGEVQIGFTADNVLDSDGEFIDKTPDDSFPFMGVNTYIVGTQRLGEIIRLHGGLGGYLSSKSVKSKDSFDLIWMVGGELAFSKDLWLVGDFSRRMPLSGVSVNNPLSLGFRYEVSESAALHVGYVSEPGIQFHLMIGGDGGGSRFESESPGTDLLF